ncbi:hypothetical protein CYCD_14470 [Tenuifilaceae bacterium CYCD]|nr:hypothetical protein CYCD_14470 [Tenuifilaceae bacterium CYCD]
MTIAFAYTLNGQSLLDVYKSGKVSLEPESNFAVGANWEKIFPDYSEVSYGNSIGYYKSIAVASDGSVFVGNYSSYTIQKFSPKGDLVLTFGKKGKGVGEFSERPTLGGVIGNKYVFTHELNGHIKIFSTDGNYIKTIKVDYLPLKTIACGNKIALIGHVSIREKVRYVITLIDPETDEQKIIKKYDDISVSSMVVVNKNNYMISFSPMFTKAELMIRSLPNGNLIVGINTRKLLEEYSVGGKLVKSFNLDFEAPAYPEDLKKEFMSGIEKRIEENKFTKEDVSEVYEPTFFPKNTLYYYNFLVDSDGNLLVFRFIDEDVDHKFRVYSFDSNGKSLAETTLDVSGFKLSLNYRFEDLCFFNGFAYGLLHPKSDKMQPLQLVKFKVKANQ